MWMKINQLRCEEIESQLVSHYSPTSCYNGFDVIQKVLYNISSLGRLKNSFMDTQQTMEFIMKQWRISLKEPRVGVEEVSSHWLCLRSQTSMEVRRKFLFSVCSALQYRRRRKLKNCSISTLKSFKAFFWREMTFIKHFSFHCVKKKSFFSFLRAAQSRIFISRSFVSERRPFHHNSWSNTNIL